MFKRLTVYKSLLLLRRQRNLCKGQILLQSQHGNEQSDVHGYGKFIADDAISVSTDQYLKQSDLSDKLSGTYELASTL
jgi:hypothetical protein